MTDLYLIDFDRTSFMSDRHSHAMLRLGIKHGYFDPDHEDRLKSKMFNEQNTVDTSAIFQNEGVEPTDIFDLVTEAGETFLYPDVVPFLKQLSAYHIVTTASDLAEQHAKLRLVNLHDKATVLDGHNKGEYIRDTLKRVDGGLIFPDHHESLAYDRITVVDDRHEAIEALYDIDGVRPILIQRHDAKYRIGAERPGKLIVVESLDEVV